MLPRSLILILFLVAPSCFFAQGTVLIPKDPRTLATEELETVVIESASVDNKNAAVSVRSRAAALVSFSDPARAESMFQTTWKFVNDQTDQAFDKEKARLVILKHLYPRNPKLARQLLSQGQKREHPSDVERRDEDLAGKLGAQLTDIDPVAAASLLERSLSASATPGGLAALSRLREKDSILSDYIASRVLDALATRPSRTSLSSLFLMTAYVFPGNEAPIMAGDAETSLWILQYRYFTTGLELLRMSLTETNEALVRQYRYSERDLQFRAAHQAQIAAILAALAPRFQPSLTVELNAITSRLAPQVPAHISQMTRFAIARLSGNHPTSDNPEENLASSLSNGDFGEAHKFLDKIKEDQKKAIYTQLVLRSEARARLATSDVMGALTVIRKLEDHTIRLVIYLEALKAAKRNPDLTNIVINEARLLIPQTGRNGLHLRALLSFASHLTTAETAGDAKEFLNSAVITINALAKSGNERDEAKTMSEAAMQELNDPNNLLDAIEMEQAFSAIGLLDLEGGLALASRIESKPVQLIARMQTIQKIIKREPPKSKIPVKPAISNTPKG